ncbi:MAG: endolytic transglycosylase MltG [bacterium]
MNESEIKTEKKSIDNEIDSSGHISPKVFAWRLFRLFSLPIVALLLIVVYFVSAPMVLFEKPVMIEIISGDTMKTISTELKDAQIIRSADLLRLMITIYGGQNKIKAGVYEFDSPSNIFNIAYRLSHQDYGYIPIKLTFPEGINSRDVLSIINSKFPNLVNSTSSENDKLLITSKEGYLFPDTYFFPPNADIKMIVDRMLAEYKRKIEKYSLDISKSGHTESEIIIMASILEEEVRTAEDRKIVADLLWRRITNGMPLQVDSSIGYINGKKSSDLTLNDLAMNSAYNTYKNKGLPPTPISNPGIDAIEAAISPIKNDYIFFLTGNDGKTYFSKTYAEHLKFKRLYIR